MKSVESFVLDRIQFRGSKMGPETNCIHSTWDRFRNGNVQPLSKSTSSKITRGPGNKLTRPTGDLDHRETRIPLV